MKHSQEDLELFAYLAGNVPKLREFLLRRFNGYVDTVIQTPDQHVLMATRGKAAEARELIDLLDTAKDSLQKQRTTR